MHLLRRHRRNTAPAPADTTPALLGPTDVVCDAVEAHWGDGTVSTLDLADGVGRTRAGHRQAPVPGCPWCDLAGGAA